MRWNLSVSEQIKRILGLVQLVGAGKMDIGSCGPKMGKSSSHAVIRD